MAGEMSEVVRALGRVEGKLDTLETAQATTAAQVRADVATLHGKIDTVKAEFAAAVGDLYRNGTAFCPVHRTHEDRLRAVEGWKDNQTGAAAAAGGAEGSKRGGLWGAVASVAVAVAMLIADKIAARLEKRSDPPPPAATSSTFTPSNTVATFNGSYTL